MKKIVKIVISSYGSGYCGPEYCYSDKLVICEGSIRYSYQKPYLGPIDPDSDMLDICWKYQTRTPFFQSLFGEATNAATVIMSRRNGTCVTDTGQIVIRAVYDDYTCKTNLFYDVRDDHQKIRPLFDVIRRMVPGCEAIPQVLLLTCEDEETCKKAVADWKNKYGM